MFYFLSLHRMGSNTNAVQTVQSLWTQMDSMIQPLWLYDSMTLLVVDLRSGKEFLGKKADANKIEHTIKRRRLFPHEFPLWLTFVKLISTCTFWAARTVMNKEWNRNFRCFSNQKHVWKWYRKDRFLLLIWKYCSFARNFKYSCQGWCYIWGWGRRSYPLISIISFKVRCISSS